MDVQTWLYAADKMLFRLINRELAVPWLDEVMLLLREPLTWVPLYIGLLVWCYRKLHPFFWWFLLFSLVTFALTDFTSSSLLKPWLSRLRPCYDPQLQTSIRSLIACGGRYSLPSAHAANHFGLAMFWYRSMYFLLGKKWNWVWLWAGLICYAQVYVGKHYPSDILAGALLGLLTGWCNAQLLYGLQQRHFRHHHPAAG
jgi:undecaprenyl-diphosphatase